MLKPVGSVCNLACEYCYYLEKKKLYPDAKNYVLSDDLLETFKSNWTRITYEQKKQMLKTKKRIETIDSAVFSEYVHSMIALIDYPGIGIKSMESCFDFVMNMREEQTLFGNR